MAYPTFEKYDFYTKPETEDFSFTKSMVAQRAAENTSIRAQKAKDKALEKEKNLSFRVNGSYENDNSILSKGVLDVYNETMRNKGDDTPTTAQQKIQLEAASKQSALQKAKEDALRKMNIENATKDKFYDPIAGERIINSSIDGKDYTTRGDALSKAESIILSDETISQPKVIADFLTQYKDPTIIKWEKENPNSGITKSNEITNRSPFQVIETDPITGLKIAVNKVTPEHVQSYFAHGGDRGGTGLYRRYANRLSSKEGYEDKLKQRAIQTLQAEGFSQDAIDRNLEAKMAMLKDTDIMAMGKEDLEIVNQGKLEISDKSNFQETAAQKDARDIKNKGKDDPNAIVTALDLNSSQRVVKAAKMENKVVMKDKKGDVITQDVPQNRDFSLRIQQGSKPVGFTIKNTDLLNLSSTKGTLKTPQSESTFYPTEVERAWGWKGKPFYGKVDKGERIDNVVGYVVDESKMDEQLFAEYKRLLQNKKDIEVIGKMPEFSKHIMATSTVLTPTLAELMKKKNIDLNPYFEEKSKRPSNVSKVKSDDDYLKEWNSLKSGQEFTDPNGNIRIKP